MTQFLISDGIGMRSYPDFQLLSQLVRHGHVHVSAILATVHDRGVNPAAPSLEAGAS